MARKALISCIFALVVLASPAFADEIVYFTNGTSMAIESHVLLDEAVRVNLGGQAFMEFPREQIDKIETASGRLSLTAAGANRIVPGGHATPVTSQSRSKRAFGTTVGNKPAVNQDFGIAENGLAVYKVFGSNAAANKGRFGATGRRELQNASGVRSAMPGTRRVGSTTALPSGLAERKQQLIGIEASATVKNNKKDQ